MNHLPLIRSSVLAAFVSAAFGAAAEPAPGLAAQKTLWQIGQRVVNTMRGGIGVSWHAIEEPIPVSEKPHPVFPNKSHGGSGWGAYPPAEDETAWARLTATPAGSAWTGTAWSSSATTCRHAISTTTGATTVVWLFNPW